MKRKSSSLSVVVDKKTKEADNSKHDFKLFLKRIDKSRNTYFLGGNSYNEKRVRHIGGPVEVCCDRSAVLYWMSREQRVQDNWAFIYAQKLALKYRMALNVCFCLVPRFLDATIRHFGFLLGGLREVEEECRRLNIPFHLLLGPAGDQVPVFVTRHDVGVVVTDFSPLRVPLRWLQEVSAGLPAAVSLLQVDAHNVVPVWEASPKREVGARTLRPRINRQLPAFLTEFPPVIRHPNTGELPGVADWDGARGSLQVDMTVPELRHIAPGTRAGLRTLHDFVSSQRLEVFNTHRNDPTKSCLSNLSPWLHFGHVAPQRCILEAQLQRPRAREGVDIFVEEALVRRELADNFCFYNEDYDDIRGASPWAQQTLAAHRTDKRPYEYSLEQLTAAETHDQLWNAAQRQMSAEGKMHGFLRMYWAKKVLEWTAEGPEEALRRAIWLNDRFSIDGRDPNGYVGIMWSICGVHDQGWKERAVFGKVRYMNYKGCERKFDVKAFEARYK